MRKSSLETLGLIALGAMALSAAPGCESHDDNDNGGRVISRDQSQQTNPDGTQIRTREQVRETSSGQTVRETETQTREPVGDTAK